MTRLTMDKDEVSMEDLMRYTAAMAQAIPDLDCPECCECGWTYHYIERSAEVFREEMEWAVLVQTMVLYRRRQGAPHRG
ncbi:hypothetical protein [Noviherbaspirillum malthae]|uniref:hypothetical protein n=1 Tax=Noviherbaspirillum malthae TaxID=1260987 RepID=UPI00188EBE14|nr:hypothetical protein [Noviherbaspirillum malthae]